MAKVLSEFPKSRYRGKYPWDKWFDGRIWELTPGKDFQSTVKQFVCQIHAKAAIAHLKVRTRTMDTGEIVVQAYKPESKDELIDEAAKP